MQRTPNEISFGLKPRVSKYGDGTFPCYTERFELMDRKLWKPVSLNRHVQLIYNQLDGMCTSNGSTGAMMVERSIRNRLDNPILSPEYLYYLHSKWGSGSTLGENLRALQERGTLTVEQAGRTALDLPDDHEILAGENKMLEWVDLDADFDAVATALQRSLPCLIGVRWPGGGGHAVLATELVRFNGSVGGTAGGSVWGLRGPNSWKESWGDRPDYSQEEKAWLKVHGRKELTGGWYTLTERQCADFRTFGCWAVGTSL